MNRVEENLWNNLPDSIRGKLGQNAEPKDIPEHLTSILLYVIIEQLGYIADELNLLKQAL